MGAEGIPVWAWIVSTLLSGGLGTAVGPKLIDVFSNRGQAAARKASIEADAVVKLQPVWNNTVKFLQSQIEELRAEGTLKDAKIDELVAQLKLQEAEIAELRAEIATLRTEHDASG